MRSSKRRRLQLRGGTPSYPRPPEERWLAEIHELRDDVPANDNLARWNVARRCILGQRRPRPVVGAASSTWRVMKPHRDRTIVRRGWRRGHYLRGDRHRARVIVRPLTRRDGNGRPSSCGEGEGDGPVGQALCPHDDAISAMVQTPCSRRPMLEEFLQSTSQRTRRRARAVRRGGPARRNEKSSHSATRRSSGGRGASDERQHEVAVARRPGRAGATAGRLGG